MNLRQV